jgi:RNA polymerase primary sigma factor
VALRTSSSRRPSIARAPATLATDPRDAAAATTLDQYLREIGRYPLISRDEEVALARRIHDGDQEALDDLARANLRFVVSVAKKYQHQGVLLIDLINEGNLGLLHAARKFDETRGIKFISYAVWWVRQAILQAITEQSRIVRVPLNRAGMLHRISRQARTLRQELGREPTHAEIADRMELSAAEVESTMWIAQRHVSLDEPLASGVDACRLDYLADEQGAAPDEQVIERALRDTVAESLASLKGREATILRLYFGFDDADPMTLEQIGRLFGVTRERVRQIKAAGLARMRLASRAHALKAFVE